VTKARGRVSGYRVLSQRLSGWGPGSSRRDAAPPLSSLRLYSGRLLLVTLASKFASRPWDTDGQRGEILGPQMYAGPQATSSREWSGLPTVE
jgi:hypothetical protein